jgi:putative protease
LATPRIHKPGEDGVLNLLRRYATHGVLVRNLAAIQYFRDCDIPFVADYSLNVANPITAEMIIEMGAKRATASYDLNRDQLLDLVQQTPPQWLEIVVHQHVPMFHMEHCVFCAVLSPGTNKTNCGRPCDDHTVHLKDRIGKQHLLTADVGCRNTLYNATPQSGAELVPLLLRQGVQWFRIELLDPMQPKEVHRVITLYEQLLANQIKAKAVWGQLKALNRVGITRGTLESSRDPLAIL